MTNFRVIPTCPHHRVTQFKYKSKDDEGMVSMCDTCHTPVAWSTKNDPVINQKLTEEYLEKLR